jgi:hypothetical protein
VQDKDEVKVCVLPLGASGCQVNSLLHEFTFDLEEERKWIWGKSKGRRPMKPQRRLALITVRNR